METIDPRGVAKFDRRGMIGTINNGNYQTWLCVLNIEALGLLVSEKKFFIFSQCKSICELSVSMETTILIQSAPKPNAVNPLTQ